MARLYVCRTCYGGTSAAINIRVSNHTASPSVTVGAVRRELAEATAEAKARQEREGSRMWQALYGKPTLTTETLKRGQVIAPTSDLLGWTPEDLDRE